MALIRVAVDSNAYTAALNNEPDAVVIFKRAHQLLLPVTVLGELLAGFRHGSRYAENRAKLADLMASPRVALLPASAETADYYATIYAALRRQGSPIPTNDMWIAASCLEQAVPLFSLDAHVHRVDGLRCVRCWDELL